MKYKLRYSVVVRDPKGKVTFREKGKSRSFLKAWNQALFTQITQQGVSIVDTGGAARTIDDNAINFAMKVTTVSGILLGTDDTPVAIDDYKLGAEIANGYIADTMFREAAVNTPAVVVGNNCSFTTTRTFVNWSGGSITVKEMGIVCYFYSGGNKYMQATRDVFVTPLVVVYGGGVVAEYTLEVEA